MGDAKGTGAEPASTTGQILALDLAKRTGFAIGVPRVLERAGATVLQSADERRERAMANLMGWLQDEWKAARPALVVREAPLPLEAFRKRRNSQDAVQMAYGLHGVLEGMCARWNVRLEMVYPATVRRHFIGRANAGERELTKAAVVHRCQLLGLIPRDCFDEDRADAVAMWDWACANFGQRSAEMSKLFLFGERAR